MKLHEIIEINERGTDAILIDKLIPYRESLIVYYQAHFTSYPVLMVTSISNAAQYALIVPSGEFNDAVVLYLGDEYNDEQHELISFQSIMLEDF